MSMFLQQEEKLYSHWIIPVIQGYVQMENCVLDFTQSSTSSQDLSPDYGNSRYLDPLEYQLGIISRRSIHRAGNHSCWEFLICQNIENWKFSSNENDILGIYINK